MSIPGLASGIRASRRPGARLLLASASTPSVRDHLRPPGPGTDRSRRMARPPLASISEIRPPPGGPSCRLGRAESNEL